MELMVDLKVSSSETLILTLFLMSVFLTVYVLGTYFLTLFATAAISLIVFLIGLVFVAEVSLSMFVCDQSQVFFVVLTQLLDLIDCIFPTICLPVAQN